MRSRRLAPCLGVALALALVAARPASANDCYNHSCDRDFEIIFSVPPASAIGIGGLVTFIGTSVDLDRGRASAGWRITSYVFGSLNLALSLVWAGLYHDDASVALGFALPQLAIGVANLGVAIASSWRAGHPPARAMLVPMSARDSRGALAAGVGLRFTF